MIKGETKPKSDGQKEKKKKTLQSKVWKKVEGDRIRSVAPLPAIRLGNRRVSL